MNRKFSKLANLTVWLSLLATSALSAPVTVLFSNFGPGSSYNITQGNPVGNAFDGNTYAEGDTFLLGGNAVFTSARVALSCALACPDPVTVSLNRDAGNQPGAAIETFTIAGTSLGTLGSNNAPIVLNSLLDPTLIFGTRYWITVTADLNDSISWNLNTTADRSAEALSTNGGSTWFSPSGSTPGAFDISGITPEPGSIGLVFSALLLLAVIASRRAVFRRSRH
jgi:hypothetical protein